MKKHDLLHEFPEHKEKIHDLKLNNAHFRKLFDDYDVVEHDIHRIETGAEATTADAVYRRTEAGRDENSGRD